MNTVPLVLIHGYPFDHTLWDHVIPLLPQEIQVLTPDLRGFGIPVGEGEPSVDLMADDIAKLLDEQNIGRAMVAGMSMGGYVALAFAQNHQDRLAGLGLINSQPGADSEETRASRLAMVQRIRREGPEVAAQALIPKLFASDNAQKPELIRFPMEGARRAGAEGLSWALQAMADRPDRTELLKSLKVPVLIVHSTKDKIIPARIIRELAKTVPAAHYVEVKQAGHCSPVEAPEELAKALKKWIQRHAANLNEATLIGENH